MSRSSDKPPVGPEDLGFEFYVETQPAWLAVALHIYRRRNDKIEVVQPWTISSEELEPGRYRDPCARLNPDMAQALFDAFWRAGFRPSEREAEEPTSQTKLQAAHENHVADLRKVLFNPDTVSVPRTLFDRMCGMIHEPEEEEPEDYQATHAVGFVVPPESEEPESGMDPMMPDRDDDGFDPHE